MANKLKPPNLGISDSIGKSAADSAKNLLGLNKGIASSARFPRPWEEQPATFFSPIDIDGERWDKLYPYRLLVIDTNNNNAIVSSGRGSSPSIFQPSSDRFGIVFESFGSQWIFQLPITPQQLQIQTPFSIQTSASLRGVVEEHGGVRFKMIMASGTFGVWPYKPNKVSPPGSPNILQTLFAGTIEAAQNLAGQAKRFLNTISGKHPAGKPSVIKPQDDDGAGLLGTGYAYAMLLDQFLEQYAEAKRNPKNSGWRLVFDIPKQNQSFVVTPVHFVWQQSIERPSEIKYSLQFKAWRRIQIDSKANASPPPSLSAITPNLLQRIINGVDEARRTAASALNVISSVRGDFQTPLNILRQTALLVKDLAGIPIAVADLPRQIIKDYKNGIKEAIGNIAGISFKNKKMVAALNSITASMALNEGLAPNDSTASMLGGFSILSDQTDPSNEIFDNPEEYYELFNSISVSDLNLTPEQQETIDAEIGSVQNVTTDQIIQWNNELLELSNQIANLYGAGDETYSNIYDAPPPFQRLTEMTVDEFDFINKLYEVVQLLTILTATKEFDDGRIQSAIQYVSALASQSNIPYESSQSKIIVPVPFGLSIEQIAARYLGNPDRWIEIATLNALKSPYIDETGFERLLLSNANGRQFNVASNENLFVNQIITIISNNQPKTMRRIISIEKITETNYLITVDGLANLDVYTTAAKARIKAYLPGTVNSSNQIFIPADLPAPNDIRARPIPIFASDPLVGLSKVDLLLTDKSDLALDNYKDIKLAGGITNLIQALKLKFTTPLNSLIRHPDYGAGVGPGTSTADFNATDIYNKIRETIIADGRFGDIERLQLTLDGPSLIINVSVTVANGNGVLPISFRV